MSEGDRRERLRRTYLSLGLGELASATVFALAAAVTVAPRLEPTGRVALWAALAPLLVVLLQAGVYWLLARSWVDLRPMPGGLAALYRVLRWVDPVVLAGALVVVLLNLPERPEVVVLVLGVWLFAVVEYVNYFVVRLAYPVSRWFAQVGRLRTPRLVQDLRGAAGAP